MLFWMRRSLAPCLLFLFIIQAYSSDAQYYYQNKKYFGSQVAVELGGSVGIMNALTDLGGKKGIGKGFIKDLNLQNSKLSFSLYALAMYKEAIGARLEVTFGNIQGYDSILKKVAPTTFLRYERNLSFRTSIRDIQLVGEVHPLFFRNFGENEAPYWSPYFVVGIGFFTFSPEAQLDGRWYALQPLHTEGQGFAEYPDRKPYKLTQVNIPVGVGIKYELNDFLNARFEIVHRFLMTDYLDDVSQDAYVDPSLFYNYLTPAQAAIAERLSNRSGAFYKDRKRGDPTDKDAFFTVQLKIGVMLRGGQRR
jgi:hypothetical protein